MNAFLVLRRSEHILSEMIIIESVSMIYFSLKSRTNKFVAIAVVSFWNQPNMIIVNLIKRNLNTCEYCICSYEIILIRLEIRNILYYR